MRRRVPMIPRYMNSYNGLHSHALIVRATPVKARVLFTLPSDNQTWLENPVQVEFYSWEHQWNQWMISKCYQLLYGDESNLFLP